MRQLSIFDDQELVATITVIGENAFLFACSSREWSDINRWLKQGFHRFDKKKRKQIKVNPQDIDFLERVAERAQGYNFSTELVND